MQHLQGKHEVSKADDMVGTGQPNAASVGMHQGNVGDLIDDTQTCISNLTLHQQEVGLLRQKKWNKEAIIKRKGMRIVPD